MATEPALCLSVVVFGASGDLAKKKTLPALFQLFCSGGLGATPAILGVARSHLSDAAWRDQLRATLPPPADASSADAADKARIAARRALRAQGFAHVSAFLSRCRYFAVPSYGPREGAGYAPVRAALEEHEASVVSSAAATAPPCGRLFYLATPPEVFPLAAAAISAHLSPTGGAGGPPAEDKQAEPLGDVPLRSQAAQQHLAPRRARAGGDTGNAGADVAATQPRAPHRAQPWVRLIVEKPFGRDGASAAALEASLRAHLPEQSLYRIDHYLGKELVQNLIILRFANPMLSPLFCRANVACVLITMKEPIGTAGRAGYFDQHGIVRDILQNHLLQVMALLAMERPVSLAPDDVRDEKHKLLRCVQPVVYPRDVVLGQYEGYQEEPGVKPGSKCPTFAACVLRVWNDRWAGVPFILKAGKALDERKTEVRIQFKDAPTDICAGMAPPGPLPRPAGRNELVIRVQPREAIYFKLTVKAPGGVGTSPPASPRGGDGGACGCGGGSGMAAGAAAAAAAPQQQPQSYAGAIPTALAELDLDYSRRYAGVRIPDAYERLIQDAVNGDASNFVRGDFVDTAWRLFDPMLDASEAAEAPPPVRYARGSRGPQEADDLARREGFRRSQGYTWRIAEEP